MIYAQVATGLPDALADCGVLILDTSKLGPAARARRVVRRLALEATARQGSEGSRLQRELATLAADTIARQEERSKAISEGRKTLDEQIDAVRGIVARAAELETHAARHTAGGDSALDEAEARSQLEFWNAKLAKLIALRETRDRETCDLNTGARERGIDVVASAV